MNRISLSKSLAYSIFIWLSIDTVSGQVSQKIGGNPGTIDPKAVLELESTTKGFLLPRMTAVQMAAITNPTSGMIVFCTDCGVASDGELRISYNGVWQTYKGNVTGNITGTAANVTGTVAVANGGTGATTATGALTNLGAAPIASPTFTGTVTSPIYASTPQVLSDAATITWNPTSGLNASVTLGGNRTLSFASLPAVGSYGTLIVTQDATGNRTITLPTTANKVLGSASSTTIALSTAPNAKDILNFYYDGTNCYWNIGQGYGTAAPAVITNLATGVSGTLPVANGGSGSTTLTGYVKGNGTAAMTANATIPVADVTGAAQIASPTFTGTPVAPTAAAGTNTTQVATTEFVTGAIATATIPDATTTAKGKVQLAGDLAGTAAAPTVPGLALKAPIASPTFTGTVTAPIYASTPQALTYGSTINWNPTNGLNASVTLGGNATLSFTSLPSVGSYGTLIVTQDATGNRTITLPTTANKVLGSASTTTIALSTAANAKDILNFYHDGTNCYWNIGQGYGTAAPAVITNLATGVSGTLPVANGGTGAATLTGLVKGNGTGAMTAAVAGTDYVAPSGSISGNAANVTGTVAIANGGTGSTSQNFVDLTTNQTIAGSKTFSSNGSFKGQSIGVGNGTGSSNLAVGSGALNAASSGHRNTAIGSSAMQNYTGTGFDNNTSVGYNNLVAMTTGSGNTSVGAESMMAVTTGTSNTSIGNQSLIGVTGNSNVGIGKSSGSGITTGSDNTMIGTNANVSVNNLSNATAIGSGAIVATSNTMQLGNTSVSNVKTSGTITAGTVTYPNAHNSTAGQVLTTDASGLASWAAPSATTLSGVLPLANGGTGQTTIAGVKGILGLTTTNVAIGASSGTTSQGSGAVGVGNGTGQSNQGSQSVAIGYVAGNANQGANSVAIGSNAAQSGQGTQSVAIGIAANSSANNATAIGGYATAPHTNATAIGFQAATTANNTIQLGADGVTVAGSTAITNVKTTGTLTAGTVTYPNTHNSTAGQVLTVNAAGTATWAAASAGIPYTGATGAVNLGAYNLTVNEVTIGKGNGSLAENTVVGKGAMANVTGNNNTSIGSQTMPGLQTGAANTAIGSAAGYSLTSGSNNIMMGYNANMSGNPSNSIAIGTNIDVNTSNTIQLGNSSSTTLKTYAKLNSGTVTYPNAHNSVAGQVLTTDVAGVASWASPSATSMSGVLPVANGGTGISTAPANGQIDIGNGTGFTRATLTAGSGITITNTAGTITITAAVRPTTDQPTTVSAGQTSFTLSQTPVNAKVWMFINGVRTNNNAYSISGTTVTYTPASNNGYVIVAGDRVQFDYCY